MPPKITAVVALPPTKLRLSYADGQDRIFDMEPFLSLGVFRQLRDPAMFSTIRVGFGTIEWTNGAAVDPERLFEDSVPVEL